MRLARIKRPDSKRYGCDSCKKDKPTEKFVGYLGNVVWICSSCYKMLIRPEPKEVSK